MLASSKTIIGWKESVDLIDWEVFCLVSKSDTGARRSVIDATNIREIEDGWIEFDVMLHRTKRELKHRVKAPISHQSCVKSSNGMTNERYFVETRISIGNIPKTVELSLADRAGMTCRMLLGRKTLEGQFIVDSEVKYLTRKRKKTFVGKR
jgi:hypothetical protein